MNKKLQSIIEIIQQSEKLDAEQKDNLIKAVKDADKELEITAFKLERTEKVKKTTAILLEETIEELEQKRKAVEQHNRELEIEASLERVRTVAMSMNTSEDLLKICEVSFKEFQKLGFNQLRNAVIHIPNDEQNFYMDYDYSESLSGAIAKIDYGSHPIVDEILEKIRSSKDAFIEVLIGENQLKGWREFRKKTGQQDDPRLDDATALYYYLFSIGIGDIGISTFKSIDESQIKVLKRFRNVFDLAYRRYTDITKAEAQAREAEIELALERVRARTMAMQKSEELKEVIQLVYDQFVHLNIHIEHTGFILDYKTRDDLHIWLADRHLAPSEITIPCFDSTPNNSIKGAKEKGEDFFAYLLTFEEKNKFYRDLFKFIPGVPEESLEYYFNCPGLAGSGVLLENIGLYIENFSGTSFTDEENKTLMRFGKVFQQTYTRFLDLQKAEAQAREAQIEAALERVRSRSMGMHKSNELKDVVRLLYKEFRILVPDIHSVNIQLNLDSSKDINFWASVEEDIYPELYHLPYSGLPIFEKFYNAFNSPEDRFFDYLLNKEEKDAFFSEVFKIQPVPPKRKKMIQNADGMIMMGWFHKHSGIDIVRYNLNRFGEEEKDIVKRFAAAFEQTYIRFLDLQKAESQAREAEIQLALERVRARTMAMHKSDELAETAAILFQQMTELGVTPERLNICLIKEEEKVLEVWATDQEGTKISHHFNASLDEPTTGKRVYDAWKEKKKSIIIDLSGKELNDWIRYVREVMGMTIKSELVREHRIHSVAFFSQGMILTTTPEPLPKESIKLLERFADVFNLTYRRFLDLQNAEAQAREAIKQASLDRVRGEIASMRTSEDLNRITPIIWRELKTLEVPFIRCGVFIINEEAEQTHVYLSTPEGKALGVLNLNFDANELTSNTVEYWRKKQVYKEHWNKEEFINWTKSMMELGQVQNAETYQGSSTPPESLHLHFVPFAQGMLYVGDVSPLADEKLDLVKTLAEAFSIAYARYEDFNRVELALKKLDNLSKELQIKNEELENENQRKAIEFEEARELQLAMLPKQIPNHPGLDIKVFMQTATEVGGDYYDFSYRVDGSINIAIGDATGHGMKAGTLVTMMKSLFIANSTSKEIEEFFISSNAAIKNSNLKRMMAAFAMINISDHKAKFINAGMPPLYHYNKNETTVEEIKHYNLPLGAMTLGNYKAIEITLNKGDMLIMMSDGFPELRCHTDELFGYERLYSTIEKVAEKDPEEIIKYLKRVADNWSENKEPDDDVTFVVIKIK